MTQLQLAFQPRNKVLCITSCWGKVVIWHITKIQLYLFIREIKTKNNRLMSFTLKWWPVSRKTGDYFENVYNGLRSLTRGHSYPSQINVQPTSKKKAVWLFFFSFLLRTGPKCFYVIRAKRLERGRNQIRLLGFSTQQPFSTPKHNRGIQIKDFPTLPSGLPLCQH
jgi:hypothetical protein